MDSYSQISQDKFVDLVLKGIQDNVFLDIGAGTDGESRGMDFSSNSYFLEKERGWSGLLVDKDFKYINRAKTQRKCKAVCADLLEVNINDILKKNDHPRVSAYLSIDVDTATPKVVNDLDLKRYMFKIVTLEHNYYYITNERFEATDKQKNEALTLRQLSRIKFLEHGYKLLCADVCLAEYGPVEDWYINLSMFPDSAVYEKFASENEMHTSIITRGLK